jgi:hypothetical protein
MGQTADQLRQELDHKRHELTRDIDHIEGKVKETLDINRYVEQNPLLAAGLAVAGGFLLGSMMGGGKHKDEHRFERGTYPTAAYYAGGYTPTGSGYIQDGAYGGSQFEQHHPGSGSGIISGVTSGVKESFRRGSGGSTIEDTLSNMTAALTAIMVEKAKEMLDRNLPGFAEKYDQAQQRASIEGSYQAGSHRGYAEAAPDGSPLDAEDRAGRSGMAGAALGATATPYSSTSDGEQSGAPPAPTPRTTPQ